MIGRMLLVLVVTSTAEVAVLCAKPRKDGTFNGAVRIRESCKPGETQLDPAAVGFCCAASTTSTSSTSTTTTIMGTCAFS